MPSSAVRASRPDLSIVIPAFCEERRIGPTLDALATFLKQDGFFKKKNVEVLVVAANAPDKTKAIVIAKKRLFKNCTLLEPGSHVGKGRDVQFGMHQASGEIAVFMDADLATPLHHLQQFYELCKDGNDVVIGTRNLATYRPNRLRNKFAQFGNWLYRRVGKIDVEDTQCGFKMFNKKARKLCFAKQTIMGWGFDTELLAIVAANGLHIKSCRLDDWQHMPYSTYNEGVLRITGRMVKDYIRIAVNLRRHLY